MAKTPDNVVLTNTHPHHTVEEVSRNLSADYPKALYHKDSKGKDPRVAQNAAEEQALGKDWVAFKDLHIETAPAAEGN